MGTRSCIYVGHVMHARGGEHANTFRYRHAFLAIDMDELPRLERTLRPLGLPLFGWRRRALVRIDESDWTRRTADTPPTASLRDDVIAWARHRDPSIGQVDRVQLVAMPRQLGYAFNPITIFYLTRSGAAEPDIAVVEVHNTFGEPHRYLAPVGDERSTHDKQLHVSPFLPLRGGYDMHLPPPSERFLARIDAHGMGTAFTATWTGRRRPLDVRTLVWLLVRFPLGARLVTARIHWQALRLWLLRRAPFHRKPPYRHGIGSLPPQTARSIEDPQPQAQEHA
ncbi:MAG: DUF1365 domain-containing protein [Thermoleophilia bacterium]|nr:DUF1365 domain-containing protein [Thermoleophilia bacterium]